MHIIIIIIIIIILMNESTEWAYRALSQICIT